MPDATAYRQVVVMSLITSALLLLCILVLASVHLTAANQCQPFAAIKQHQVNSTQALTAQLQQILAALRELQAALIPDTC